MSDRLHQLLLLIGSPPALTKALASLGEIAAVSAFASRNVKPISVINNFGAACVTSARSVVY
jgi:hypothetical protein